MMCRLQVYVDGGSGAVYEREKFGMLCSMTKHIYFVRHGESDANKAGIRQGPDSTLSEEGQVQAERAGQRFKAFGIDHIVASPYTRTTQTAAIIHTHLHVPVEYSDLFRERKNPSEILGRTSDDPHAIEITKQLFENYHIPGKRYSDEENFEDLKERADAAVRFLEEHQAQNILVVSHGLFMRIFFARALFGEGLTSREFVKTAYSLSSHNTGIAHFEYDPERVGWDNKGWLLKRWNDHAHLE